LLWLTFSNRLLHIEKVAETAVVNSQLNQFFISGARLLDPRDDIFEILGSLVTVSSRGVNIGLNYDLDDYLYILDNNANNCSDDDSDYLADTEIGLA
jgi:hypothetical protein